MADEEDPPPKTVSSFSPLPLQQQNDNVSNVSINMANNNNNRGSTIANSQESVYKNTTFTYQNGSSTLDYRNGKGAGGGKAGMKRYRNEMKHLLPYREAKGSSAHFEDFATQIDYVNCLQFIFFSWMSPLVAKIFSGRFTLEDIQTCSPHDSCLQSSRRFKRLWTRQCSNSGLHNASLERTLFRFIRTRFLLSSFFYLICLTTGYLSSTYFLMNLLEEIERSLAPTDNTSTSNDGGLRNGTSTSSSSSSSYYTFSLPTSAALKWTACLCLCELLRAISYSIMFAVTIRTGVRTVNALSGALYEKILSKRPSSSTSAASTSNSSSNSSSAALQPTNLFANDLGKVFQLVYMLPLTIGSPIIIVVTVAYTFALIGASSAAVGMVAFLAIFALQAVITRRQAALRDRMMAAADQRISLISGLMRDIRTIKFNGWEKPLQADILHCRRSESLLLIRYQYLQCFSTSLALLTPMLITIINILMHTWLGKELSVSTAFSLVMLNYIAAHGIRSLPNYLREIVNGRVALKRIERFLRLDDQTRYLQFPVKDSNGSPANAIELRDASFSWTPPTSLTSSSEPEFTSYIPSSSSSSSTPLHRSNSGNSSFLLSNINLTVPRRRHLCLYGPVGSGKSALLLSILGQTQLFKGEVRLSSSRLAYVSQTPWLQAASIRENVLFGAPFERRRYYETLLKCQLATDIAGLADGEQTIVGEDGRQLSGGQKMRIALARAVYSDADILLLDDLFSALDGRVVRTIFSGVLNELLASKTVVFVSRHLHLLSEKTMVAMLEGGRVVKVGEHGKMVEGDEEYRKAVDRSKLIGTEKEAIEETVEGETAENTSSLPEESHQEKPNDLVEFEEEEDEEDEDDDEEDNVLFKSNGTLPPPPLKSAGAKDSTASYTSLISLLEKCDQNSFSAAHQMPNSHGDSEEFEDDEEGESRGRALDDPEGRLFRKYSAKYRQKFSSSSSADKNKKASNGNGTSSQSNSKVVSKQVAISSQTYTDYIRASGGWLAFALMLALFAAQTATATFASWWLSYWLNQGGGNSESRTSESQSLDSATMAAEHRSDLFLQNSSSTPPITPSSPSSSILANPHLHYYQTVYLVLLFVVVFTSLLMGCTYARIAVRAANALHWATLSKLITSPLAFFDAIALGRILNLFSHNIDELDGQLPVALDGFAQRALLVLGSFLLIVLTLHWLFSLPFLVFGVVFVLIYRHYRSATYWLKQADLRLRSPIYGYLSATVEGLSVVKAFSGAEDRFTRNFFRLADRQAAGHWLSLCTVRWLSIRIDLLCIAANVVVCLLVLVKLRTVGAAYAGLVITQSMQLSGLLQLVVRLALDLETRLVSVERLQAYIRLLRSERSTTMALSTREQQLNFDLSPNTSENSSKLWWPSAGRISFRAVSLRYRANLPLALKNVTFDVPGGSKVAIVGRTGAGKSSITYALFRLVEIANAEKDGGENCSGIFIDGVDIRAVPLEVLRSRLTIIPQDPVLFTGSSIRKNLDPRGKASEEQLLSVLEAVGLREKVERQCRGGLDEPIAAGSAGSVQQPKNSQPQQRSSGTSGGGGFSTGEKQLLCLARALLRGSRIIVLDEATSAVDDQMEAAIWRLVRTVFADCTVLLIAHRLQTVLDCDQVIVIRKGEVVESGDPKVLRAEPRSLFAKMVSSQSSQKVLRIKK